MATPTRAARILIWRRLGRVLMLRNSAGSLFQEVKELEPPRVVLDFSEVEFMSRSFADEYLAAKAASPKRIEEQHLPRAVRQMLALVSAQQGLRTTPSERSRKSVRVPTAITL